MAVKLRLKRMGKKKHPTYRVVAADARAPRDGRFIELIGRYDPHPDPSVVEIDNDKALKWLEQGAQPTAQVRKLLEISGAWGRFRIARGEIHTLEEAAAPKAAAPAAAVPAPGHEPEIHVVGESDGDAAADVAEEIAAPIAAVAAEATEAVTAEVEEVEEAVAEVAEEAVAAADAVDETDAAEAADDEAKEPNGAEG